MSVISSPFDADGLFIRPVTEDDDNFENMPIGTLMASQNGQSLLCGVFENEIDGEIRLILECEKGTLAAKAALALTQYVLFVLKKDSLFFLVEDGNSEKLMIAAMIGGLPFGRVESMGLPCTLYRMEDDTRDLPSDAF